MDGNLNYWITGCVTILVGIFGSTGFWAFVSSRRRKKEEANSAITKVCVGVAYLGIKMSCYKLLDRGYATPDDIEDIEKYLYEPYKQLGGNGTAEMIFEKTKSLPTKPRDEEDEI